MSYLSSGCGLRVHAVMSGYIFTFIVTQRCSTWKHHFLSFMWLHAGDSIGLLAWLLPFLWLWLIKNGWRALSLHLASLGLPKRLSAAIWPLHPKVSPTQWTGENLVKSRGHCDPCKHLFKAITQNALIMMKLNSKFTFTMGKCSEKTLFITMHNHSSKHDCQSGE